MSVLEKHSTSKADSTLKAYHCDWVEPLVLAEHITQKNWVLLYSGASHPYSGKHSILAINPEQSIESDSFFDLSRVLSSNKSCYENFWAGYLAYELRHDVEAISDDQPGWIELPALSMRRYSTVFLFNHQTKTLTCWSNTPPQLSPRTNTQPEIAPEVEQLYSSHTTAQYLQHVATIKEKITEGELYQANLTRKFYGNLTKKINTLHVFKQLAQISPSPYSAYMRIGDTAIISSSPERFIHIDEQGVINARPIKGTSSTASDKEGKKLAKSEKDKAENLMIVDLMRNDLSRCCIPTSVKVDQLYDINQHNHVNHMASSISGKKHSDMSTLEVVRQCFPPGSMTGAPKLKAMQICSELEIYQRGVYSGALGWFGGDGACDLSVVIRMLLIQGNKFEFQVGGAIVADSSPENELQETYTKAEALLALLGLDKSALDRL